MKINRPTKYFPLSPGDSGYDEVLEKSTLVMRGDFVQKYSDDNKIMKMSFDGGKTFPIVSNYQDELIVLHDDGSLLEYSELTNLGSQLSGSIVLSDREKFSALYNILENDYNVFVLNEDCSKFYLNFTEYQYVNGISLVKQESDYSYVEINDSITYRFGLGSNNNINLEYSIDSSKLSNDQKYFIKVNVKYPNNSNVLKNIFDEERPLTFKALTDNSFINLEQYGGLNLPGIEIKRGGSDWESLPATGVLLNTNEIVSFKNNNETLSESSSKYAQFIMDGKIAAFGNVQSMLNYSESCPNYCFRNLFSDCSGLLITPKLPATEVGLYSYTYMFNDCTSLIQASELGMETFTGNGSCIAMFYNCSSLIQPPELKPMTLKDNCYNSMFWGCSSLIIAPELPASDLAKQCYQSMFAGCISLTQAPALPASGLANSCYQSMFRSCKSLIQAPELPATTLVSSCYQSMFNGCTKLSSISVGFIDWNESENSTTNWVNGVASFGEFNCPNNLSVKTGNSRIPNDWAIQKPSVLTLTAAEDNVHVQLTKSGSPTVDGLQYKKSDSEWIKYTIDKDIPLSSGEYVEFRNTKSVLSYLIDDERSR